MAEAPVSDLTTLRTALANAEAEAARTKAINADLAARVALLELQNEKMRRALYGQRAERGRLLVDQLELAYEEVEATAGEDETLGLRAAAGTAVVAFTRARPSRQPLPAHLPRERVVIPAPASCPCCGSDRLSKLGEDVTETLEVVPRRWKVVQTVRERFACRACETVTQPPAPFHATPRGLFGPSFLAMLLFEKFGTHQPLNRQRDRYAREGVDLSLSTLADQVGACAAVLKPLYLLIEAHVLAAERLHGDDTTVPVLAKTKTDVGRLWTYVRDDRPFAGPAPPAALFRYSRDRRAEHPVEHLTGYGGILQADAYAGYNALFRAGQVAGTADAGALLGAFPTQVLRAGRRRDPAEAAQGRPRHLAGRGRSRSPHRPDLRCRTRHHRHDGRASTGRTPGACRTAGRRARAMAARPTCVAGPSQPRRRGDRLHAQGLDRVHPVPRRWPHLPDQQCRRTRVAWCRPWQEGMAVRRLRSAAASAPRSCTR